MFGLGWRTDILIGSRETAARRSFTKAINAVMRYYRTEFLPGATGDREKPKLLESVLDIHFLNFVRVGGNIYRVVTVLNTSRCWRQSQRVGS
jgi:hypothetical protein